MKIASLKNEILISVLLGPAATIDAIKAGQTPAVLRQRWAQDLDQFQHRRMRYLLFQPLRRQ